MQIAKHGKFSRMEWAQIDYSIPFARSRSDSELMCFIVEAQHFAAAPGTSQGQEWRQVQKSDTFQLQEIKEQTPNIQAERCV